jgi:hypothetical protein
VEVALAHAAVAEDDSFEFREAEIDQVEAAVIEGHIADAGLGKVGAREPAPAQLDSPGVETTRWAVICPVDPFDYEVNKVAKLGWRRDIVVWIGSIRGERWLSQAASIRTLRPGERSSRGPSSSTSSSRCCRTM